MRTRVFISWSGELSKALAETLKIWLPSALQNVSPYFSPEDIEKGSKWDSSIATELEESHVGLICLTPDNTEKPWILFEAGALSKSIERGRVCTVLFGIDPSQIQGPLLGFQATQFNKDDFRKLIRTINASAGEESLDPQVLDAVFEMWWPQLEEKVNRLLEEHKRKVPAPKARGERDILEEVLNLSRRAASRDIAFPIYSSRAIEEIVATISDLFYFVPPEEASRLARDLAEPLAHIARASDTGDPMFADPELLTGRLLRRTRISRATLAKKEVSTRSTIPK